MRTFLFEKEKYGFELLMDLHKFEENKNLYFEEQIHTTNFFEIFIFETANGKIELNGDPITIRNHSLFFISPFQKKRSYIDTSNIKGFHLVFKNDFLSNFFEDKLFVYKMQYFYNTKEPQHLTLNIVDYENLRYILNEITEEIKNFKDDSTHIIRALLYFFLSKINRIYAQTYKIPSETQGTSIIYKFKEALEQNIKDLHKVEDYCQLLKTSRHKLNNSIKNYTGHTTKDLIHSRLLQEIKMELLYSEKTIQEIANTLSFSEPNNLTRFFMRLEGTSPSEYRMNYQIDSY